MLPLVLGLGAVACGSSRGAPSAPAAAREAPAERPSSSGSAAVAPAEPATLRSPRGETTSVVAILDPLELRRLDAGGFDFASLAASASARTTRQLHSVPALEPLFDTLSADVQAAARPFPLARVTSVDGFRLFDARWLSSSEMSFALTGVFNRLDRRPFYEGTCGEIRFLYRLAYATSQGGKPMTSRLPMTLNVVFLVDDVGDTGCARAARLWQAPANLTGDAVTSWLLSKGALSVAHRGAWRLKSVESNLQTFRLQSSVHPSMAGHIEYGLRVFHPNEARTAFAPAAMENMPDVAALGKSSSLRADLLAYLKKPEVLADIDRGTLRVPERFLAKQAVSFSPRGLSRLHNRPFRRLFDEGDFSEIALDAYQTIRSPAALIRRLDAASCVGCHQSRSIAGFHHVGLDPVETPTFNALLSGSSSHLNGELARRRSYVEALASGAVVDEFRPFPERQGGDGKEGAPCGLGDAGFADWTCAARFSCVKVEDPEVGICLAEGAIGGPCEYGTMTKGARPHRDQITAMERHACGAAQSCDTNFQGFPQGACSARCESHLTGGSCADFLDVDGFQNCLRSKQSFERCAGAFVFGVAAAECDSQRACRQDYVCARTRKDGVGACVPPYFVYQLRLDGYPIMR
jgi:hypothetical protein